MLTITDLTIRNDLDRAAMSRVSGGFTDVPGFPTSFYSIANMPTIDAGNHFLAQGQSLGVNQAYNLGGLNLVISDQTQNGIAGQVAV